MDSYVNKKFTINRMFLQLSGDERISTDLPIDACNANY